MGYEAGGKGEKQRKLVGEETSASSLAVEGGGRIDKAMREWMAWNSEGIRDERGRVGEGWRKRHVGAFISVQL